MSRGSLAEKQALQCCDRTGRREKGDYPKSPRTNNTCMLYTSVLVSGHCAPEVIGPAFPQGEAEA